MKQNALVSPPLWRKNVAFCPWPKTLVALIGKEARNTVTFLGAMRPTRSSSFRSAVPWPALHVLRLDPNIVRTLAEAASQSRAKPPLNKEPHLRSTYPARGEEERVRGWRAMFA